MKGYKLFLAFVLLVGVLMFASAAYTLSNPQLTHGGTFSSFGKDATDTSIDQSMCQEGQDFIVQIAPFGCEPAVVRSDLLEEQDVPIFCKLQAVKINPFIDITSIDSINIIGEYPREVKSVGFTPSYAALGENKKLNNLQWDEIGYATIVLRQNPNESSMPDFVTGNLSAKITYDLKNAFGLQKHTFYLPILTDNEFDDSIGQYSFFNKMGYLRAEDVTKDSASVVIYSGRYESLFGKSRQGEIERQRIWGDRLSIGQITDKIYLPGFDCFSAVQFRLEAIEFQDTRVRLNINSQIFEVKEDERFLNNKCYINEIKNLGLNQIVKVYCQADEGADNFDLRISPKVKLKINGIEGDYAVGDYLFETSESQYAYLGYLGSSSYEVKDLVAYVVLATEKMPKLRESEILVAGKLGELNPNEKNILSKLKYVSGYSSNFYRWIMEGNSFQRLNSFKEASIGGKVLEIIGFGEEDDYVITSEIENYYEKALDDYDYIFSNYRGEVYPEEEKISLGEKSAYAKMLLARDIFQNKDLNFFCDEFESNYPDSTLDIEFCENLIFLSNQGISTRDLVIDGEIKRISFEGVYQPDIEDYGVILYVRNKGGEIESHELKKEQILYLTEKGNEYVQLVSIRDEDNVVLKIQVDDKSFLQKTGDLVSSDRILKKEIAETFGNYTFIVHDINVERVAKVSVEPSINYAGSEVDFNFAVGIEKRLIQLSPEMTEKAISKLNGTIETWESISSTLGGAVDILEDACLAVGGVLTLKNLLFNSGGESFARQEVMSGTGGWYERCAEMIVAGNYKTEEECIQNKAGEIDNEVNLLADMLKSQNEGIKTIQENDEVSQSQGLFGTKVVNTTKLVEEYLPQVKSSLNKRGEFVVNPNKISEKISVSSLEKLLTIDSWENNLFSFDLLKEIELYANILNKGGLDSAQTKSYESKLFISVKQLDINSEKYVDVKNWASSVGINSEKIDFIEIGGNVKELPYDGVVFEDLKFGSTKEYNLNKLSSHVYVLNQLSQLSGNYKSDIGVGGFIESLHDNKFLTDAEYISMKGEDGKLHDVSELNAILPISKSTKVKLLQGSDGMEYILILKNSGIDKLTILQDKDFVPYIYNGAGNRLLVKDIPNEVRNIYCKIYDASSYKNSYKNPKITYYETDPYKGLPSVVPFDTNDGWYAYVEQSMDFVGQIRSYDKSARVNSFWLCNVGSNGLEEFSKGNTGDDICQLINLGTGQAYNQFSGLKTDEAAKKIDQAVNAIEYASKGYKDGVKTVKIGNQNIEVGSPAISSSLTKCEDYMSPKDCNLLFNVCDPVICPSSRCNFGGQYPVQDVIQSGIIGSLLLCLPNYHEDIYMPVCLTGVKSGIDSYLSVMKSYKSCLQESLDTGSTVGVCDQINSIYLCEFFWRQALPLAQLTLPKIIGAITGENTRGGGEYSNLNAAWDNAKNSVNFFTEFYAINSFNSFKARSQEEIGSEVCKSFISVSYPEGQGILDSLTIKNSPPQYSGNFEAIPFTTATVPAVSQYKVFYHIYAGEDQGAYYKVYLRGGSGSSYYQDTFSGRMVASGYIPVGEYATGTEDFTAPEGYQELCIAVNNQEQCGFKQVSTSFVSDYIKDKSRQSQIETTNIKSQDECVSGSANIYGLLNLNAQEGIGNTIDPEIYNQGIVRICATDNPGKGSDNLLGSVDQRWIDVGYCGDTNVRCWFDQESIDRALEFQSSKNESLAVLANRSKENLENKNGYLTPEQFAEKVENITQEKDREKKFKMVDELFDKVYLNNHKAYLYFLRAEIYEGIVKELFSKLTPVSDKDYSEEFFLYGNKSKTVLGIVTAKGFESGEFVFNDGTNDNDLFYKFLNGAWNVRVYVTNDPVYLNSGRNPTVAVTGDYTWINVSEVDLKNYNVNNQEFISKLIGKSYLGGLDSFMLRVKLDGEGGIVNPDLSSRVTKFKSNGEFQVEVKGASNIDNLYLKYENKKWYWDIFGVVKKDWKSVDNEVLPLSYSPSTFEKLGKILPGVVVRDGTYRLPEEYNNLIYSLRGKDLTWGAAILFGDVSPAELKVEVYRLGIWSYAAALEEVKKLEGNYENFKVKGFIDQLYEDGLLTKEDYLTMKGEGGFFPEVSFLNEIFADYVNLEGDVKNVDWSKVNSKCKQYYDLFLSASQKYGIPLNILIATVNQESGCNILAHSTSSYGLMQVRADAAGWCGQLGLPSSLGDCQTLLTTDAEKSIFIGAQILKEKKYDLFKEGIYQSTDYKTNYEFKEIVDNCVVNNPKYSKYVNWEAALRGYNGWGCGSGADVNYVEKITNLANKIYSSQQDSFLKSTSDETSYLKNGIVSIPGGEVCSPPGTTPTSVEALSNPREKVLKMAEELVGKSAYLGSVGCFSAVKYVYDQAGVQHNCVYSDSDGRKYSAQGGIEVDTKPNCTGVIFCVNNQPTKSCSLNKVSGENLEMSYKLGGIKPGDILSYVYDNDDGHNVIFINWSDSRIAQAWVFDWNGPRVNGKKTYRYTEVSLQDITNPVYMYWQPVISGQTKSFNEDIPVSSLELEDSVQSTVQDTTAPTTKTPIEIQTTQYTLTSAIEKAKSLKEEGANYKTNLNFMDVLLDKKLINRVEYYKYSGRWGGYELDIDELIILLEGIQKDELRISKLSDISLEGLSGVEEKLIKEAQNCNQCGSGSFNSCNEQECFVLGIALGKNCEYDYKMFGDSCLEK